MTDINRHRGLAIASLILGGISCFCCFGTGIGVIPAAIALVFSIIAVAKGGKNAKKLGIIGLILGAIGLVLNAVILAYGIWMIRWDHMTIENLSSINLDINQLLFGLLGVAMIIFGNIMPKLRMNSVAGLRTVWSMKNETTWKKSQRFGGISFIIGGIIIIIVCFLTKGFSCFSWTMGIVAILLLVDIYYTYTLSKKI